ncbi:MAG: DUF1810 domain-containing protein [Lachnospiraceae bacterium]|nr:DUF1810 domain-containing protein [Lachnospiraceae bacterium]
MADLSRFHEAQKYDYDIALSEIKNGRKMSCWMWYIFPQLKGLGMSSMARYYGISDLQEAREYMADEKLRSNLLEISGALLELDTDNPTSVMGVPDDMKLCSCMTLFAKAAPDEKVFFAVLDKFFHGEPDQRTLAMIKENGDE